MKTSASLGVVLAAALAGSASPSSASSIAPIHINGDTGFSACGCATQVDGVWVIGPWSISGAPGDGVLIENATAPFRLMNMTVTNSKGAGIHLKNAVGGRATVVSGTQTSLQNNNIGLVIENSQKPHRRRRRREPGGMGDRGERKRRDDQQELPRRRRRRIVLGRRHSRLGPQRQRAGRNARLGRLRPGDPTLERRRRPLRERHRFDDRPQFGEQRHQHQLFAVDLEPEQRDRQYRRLSLHRQSRARQRLQQQHG